MPWAQRRASGRGDGGDGGEAEKRDGPERRRPGPSFDAQRAARGRARPQPAMTPTSLGWRPGRR